MKELDIDEYVNCRQDPVYFLKKYGKVRHPVRGLIPFDLWDFQEDAVEDFLEHPYNIILKARQLGISTLCAGYVSWLMRFFKEKEIYILATKQKTATNLVTKVKVFLENLPEEFRPEFTVSNRQSLELANGSKVQASGTTPDAARSEALSLLIIDEAAFVKGMDEIWVAAQPTLATGGDCIALSSPNGVGNWFHKYYTMAESGEKMDFGNKSQAFHPIKMHWSLHPDRNQEWADSVKTKIGDRAFAQEYDADFLHSGATVVDVKDVIWYKKNPTIEEGFNPSECPYVRDPVDKTYLDKGLWIWKYADPNKQYIMGVDTARGDGEDFSAFHVVDIESYEQVAEYKGKISTDLYSNLVVSTAMQYNQAFIVIENNGIGHSTAMKILELGYQNIHWTIKDHTRIHQENAMYNKVNPYNVPKNAIPGFTMSSRTRPNLIARIEEDIRNKDFIMHSKRLYEELFTFVFENGKPQAMRGYNDDLIMSLGMLMFVRYNDINIFGSEADVNRSMISNIGYNNNEYGFSGILSSNESARNQYKILAGEREEDLRWLLG